jgi:hypothetical protein
MGTVYLAEHVLLGPDHDRTGDRESLASSLPTSVVVNNASSG